MDDNMYVPVAVIECDNVKNVKSRNILEEDPITSRSTFFPVMEKPSEAHL